MTNQARITTAIVCVLFLTTILAVPAFARTALQGVFTEADIELDGIGGDHAGYAVAAADVNGDGLDDMIVGAWLASPIISGTPRDSAGAVYVFFGRTTPLTAPVTPDTLGDQGFIIVGAAVDDNLAWAVSSAGDQNGDGKEDILVGTILADPNGSASGAAYVVFGKSTTDTVDLAALGNGGYAIYGALAGDRAGYAVSDAAGDLNGDGIVDLIIGANSADFTGSTSGSAYVVFGKASTDTINLAALGNGGYRIDGPIANARLGSAVAGVPDLNGDGLPEALVGGFTDASNGANTGSAYLVFGQTTTNTIQVASLGNRGFAIRGAVSGDRIGISLASLGDVNGDGLSDLLLGREENNAGAGGAVVVFGKTTTSTVVVNALGNAGYRINGAPTDENLGYAVSAAGDVNKDGIPDALIGGFDSANGGVPGAGAAYVVFGQASTETIQLTDPTGIAYRYDGTVDGGRLGRAVGAGDVNGDGVFEPILGADLAGADAEGAAYVYFTPVQITAVAVDGPASGAVNTTLTFDAAITPVTSTLPVTYTWSAAGQTTITQTGGITNSVTWQWATPGTYTVTVAADNGYAVVSDTTTMLVIVPLANITVSGPTSGATGESLSFTALSAPVTTTLPITYTWSAPGQTTITQTSGITDSVTWEWVTAGTYTVTVSADNGYGVASDTTAVLVITPLSDVTLSGPTSGTTGTSLDYTALSTPITVTQPITYVWSAPGQTTITQTGDISDTVAWAWTNPGTYTVTVRADNGYGTATDNLVTVITAPPTAVTLSNLSILPTSIPVMWGVVSGIVAVGAAALWRQKRR